MTIDLYDETQQSVEDARPQSLYHFKINNVEWRYTNGTEAVLMHGAVWLPLTISDSGARQKGDVQADVFELECQSDIPIVRFFMSNPPTAEVEVTARRFNRGEAESEVYFVGALTNVNMPQPGKATLSCTAVSASLEREGLRLTWSKTCPYSVYDQDCRVNRALFAVTGAVSTSENGIITVTAAADYEDNWFSGGSIQWEDPERGLERLGIESHTTDQLTIFGTSLGLKVGTAVTIYPGCNRTTLHCKDKFDNIKNYGGIPDMPGKSPFNGEPIF